MDHFAALRALRAIVDAGSFTAAAERLGTTHSAMSRQLRQLEEHLQVRLLDRNSRRLSLTEAGRDYYREAATLLDRLQEADDRARAGQRSQWKREDQRAAGGGQPGAAALAAVIPAALPQVTLDLSADDQLVDVVGGGFDLALRIAASLPDSQLVARELASCPRILVAAPAYLAHHGLPRQAADLAHHTLLGFSPTPAMPPWQLQGRAAQPRASKPGSACAWMPRRTVRRRAGRHGHQPVHRLHRAGGSARRSFDPRAAGLACGPATLLRAVPARARCVRAGRASRGALRCTGERGRVVARLQPG